MALSYVTGHDLTLTINSVSYANVAASATLAIDINQVTLETLAGRAYKTIDRTGTLTVELYQDWGSTSPASVCAALWDAAKTSPDTSLTFSLGAGSATFTGSVYPVAPTVGGGATDALTTSVTLVIVSGTVTKA